MLGMKNHFDISGSIEIREVDIARVACMCIILSNSMEQSAWLHALTSVDIWQTKYVALVEILICFQALTNYSCKIWTWSVGSE